MSRCACQPVLTPTIMPRVGRRRWTTVKSTFSPLGSSTIETSLSSFPQVKTSLRGGSSSMIRLSIRCSSPKPSGRLPGGSVSSLLRQTNSNGAPTFISMSPGRQPLAPQIAVGEIGPDPLDRARQHALDRQRGRLAQRAIGVDFRAVVHFSSPCLAGRGFLFVLLAEEPIEDVEARGPEALVEAQPLMRGLERSRIEATEMGASAHLALDQSGAFQDLDVLRGRRERDGEGLERAGRRFARRR